MPELPDVEVYKNYLTATSLHQKIAEIEIFSEKILENTSPQDLRERLTGHSIESAKRHGKYLFIGFDNLHWLMMHFGMTGFLQYFKENGKALHIRLLFSFTNGYHLAYINQRKFGKIMLIDSPGDYIHKKHLGPDVLDLDFITFEDILETSRGIIKTTLMNQSSMAGIGNIYSDEILFQSGISPKTNTRQLTEEQKEKLFKILQEVLETAIDAKVNPENFPESYLINHRNEGEKCPRCNGKIEKIKISNRSSYFCPHCQA